MNGDLDKLPQLSWILFLKCYDDLEIRREEDAKATRQKYKPIIPPPYRWRDWASNEDEGATGEELIKFVNDGLLPALRGLSGTDERLKVAEVFKETYNRMLSGYLLREWWLSRPKAVSRTPRRGKPQSAMGVASGTPALPSRTGVLAARTVVGGAREEQERPCHVMMQRGI